MRRLEAGSDFSPGATKILDPVVIRRQAERMEAARAALEPLLELARKVNGELGKGTPWETISDLPWWGGWACIERDLETALENLR